MRGWRQSLEHVDRKRETKGVPGTGSNMDRKYPVALVLYAVLVALCWFTLEGTVVVMGKPVELRLVPLLIIGGLALRTMLAMQAEKIRRSGEQGQ
jgi:hypothetical protein